MTKTIGIVLPVEGSSGF